MAVSVEELTKALAAPFPADKLGWKPQTVSGSRALAIAYMDARDVMDRLDGTVGVANWSDAYESLADGNVVCTLSIRVSGEWVSKSDIGGESDQKDSGDRHKAAFSDALKRAAVKWGIGRYLYRLEGVWVDYDPQKKQLKNTPALPSWALPEGAKASRSPAKQASKPAAAPAPNGDTKKTTASALPKDGKELLSMLEKTNARMRKDGLIQATELMDYIESWGESQALAMKVTEWPADRFKEIMEVVAQYGRGLKAKKAATQEATP